MKKAKHQSRKAVLVISLGCAKNLVDTEVMCGSLATHNFVLTNMPDAADITLINTCGFIADARTEADSEIRTALLWKKQKRGRHLVVAGCIPQRNLAEARLAYPEVDLFLGLDDVPQAAELIDAMLKSPTPERQPEQFATATYLYDNQTPRLLLTPGNFAYVKIAEGCDHHCRFCSIPLIRGRYRSRSNTSIVDECRNLLNQGVRELILIAQDTTHYGSDRQEKDALPQLLHKIGELPGDFWIRLLYTHPRHFSPAVIEAFRNIPKLVPYVDIPLQHIADRMLLSMGRHMDGNATRELMRRIREQIPGVAVRTTFLLGYPGETDDDFAELLHYLKDYRFDRVGAFVFSPEPDTAAAKIENDLVPQKVAEQRRDILLETQQHIAANRNQELVGTEMPVLIDAETTDGFVGRSYADAPDVDNVVLFTGPDDCREKGFVKVRIQAAEAYELYGQTMS